jgi:hypothetical protein
MAINIKPDISLSVKPPATMSLPEMLNMARGAQAYQRESEVFPELVQQSQIATRVAKIGELSAGENLSKTRADKVFNVAGGFINDPRIASGDRNKTVEAMLEIQKKAIASGVPEAQVVAILSPITATAAHNPAALPQMLANVIQAQIGPSGQQALQTPQLTTSGNAPALFRAGPGSLTPAQFPEVPAAPVPAAAAPAAAVPPAAAPAPVGTAPAPKGVTSADMVASRNDPGFALPFQVRKAGDIRPFAPGEQAATEEGQKYIANLSNAAATAPMGVDRVDRVLQTISKIEADRKFQAGRPGELEAKLRAAIGDADYKLLQKELADLVIATNQAIGGKTDATTALVSQSMGNEVFPPGVLKNIATKLRGESYGLMLQAKGANKFLQLGFNEANLPRGYRAAWDENSDPRVFEAMAIFKSDRLTPQEKIAAYNKIKPTDLESLNEFERKARNIESLSNTGTLPRQKR